MSTCSCNIFNQQFGVAPDGGVRAPGRVNLIGDHTDYHGLPVFPMAVAREIRIRYRRRDDAQVRLASAGGFSPREFSLAPEIAPFVPGDWGNYAKAAAQALVNLHPALRGIDALVEGDIPEAAGMSSSSALVVGSALALLEANGIAWQPGDLAQEMARAERYVGTQGGGMDQTVCLCAQAGSALKIDFTPFGCTPVPMPPDWIFVAGNSMVTADKSLGARERYNSTHGRSRQALVASGLGSSYPELLASRPASELVAAAAGNLDADLLAAFRHVVTEAARVATAEAAMRAGDFDTFGDAMNESHASLRDDLRVSCPALDELVEAFRASGARGARVTGAGFGGCVVALARRTQLPELLEGVRTAFYATRTPDPSPYLFAVEPAAGAGALPEV